MPRIETLRLGIDQAIDFRGAFRRAVDAKMDAMLVHSSPIFVDEAAVIAELGREFRLPSIGLFPIYTKVGGFISHGPDNFELLKQVGGIVGKILRGAKPAEFPIQRPVYLSFLINMHTARLFSSPFLRHCQLWRTRRSNKARDFRNWHIASFRSAAEFGRSRCIADIEQAAAIDRFSAQCADRTCIADRRKTQS